MFSRFGQAVRAVVDYKTAARIFLWEGIWYLNSVSHHVASQDLFTKTLQLYSKQVQPTRTHSAAIAPTANPIVRAAACLPLCQSVHQA